ncbi:hypothetical protein JCM19992_05530 [Thermostilla marina]
MVRLGRTESRIALLAGVIVAATAVCGAVYAETVDLTPKRQPGDFFRIETAIEVKGKVTVDPTTEKTEPLAIAANLNYEGQILQYDSGDKPVVRSLRDYDKAIAKIRVGEKPFEVVLRPEVRLIAADVSENRTTLFSPSGPLTRDELDLLETLGDSDALCNALTLELILPRKEVETGATWTIPESTWQLLLGLDSVRQVESSAKLVEIQNAQARIEFSADVQGTVHGSKTAVQVVGRCLFDTGNGTIVWAGAVVNEQRESNMIENAFAVSARVQWKCEPLTVSERLAKFDPGTLTFPPEGEQAGLLLQPEGKPWQLVHDRRWYLVEDSPELVVLRFVDSGDYLAQCNIYRGKGGSESITLAAFKEQVRVLLGDSLKQWLSESENEAGGGFKLFRVAAVGDEQGLPVQWTYYLLTTPRDERFVFLFSAQEDLSERLGDADQSLVAGFALLDPDETAAKEKPTASR